MIGRANATLFGLGSGVWTRDVSKAHRLAKGIRAGSVWVNCYQAMDPAVPFGGSHDLARRLGVRTQAPFAAYGFQILGLEREAR